MLSILIPTFNYNALPLVEELHTQCNNCNILFEILVFDDGSNSELNKANNQINNFSNCKFKTLNENIGRTAIRNMLANAAKFDWLLFLDADVLPKKETFIREYLNQITAEKEVVYGGLAYYQNKIKKEHTLRWKYGKNCEEVNAKKRSLKSYRYIISGNFLIKKNIFIKVNYKMRKKSYGLDNYFGIVLKQLGANVFHIDNEVFHLGIETNPAFLAKMEEGIDTLLWIHNKDKNFKHENNLLRMFSILKKYRLNHIFTLFYRLFGSLMKKNLVGSNPSLNLFQIYKISYLCHIDLRKQGYV